LHRRLRSSDRVQILESLEQRLSELDRKTMRVGYAFGANAGGAIGRRTAAPAAGYVNILVYIVPVCLAAYKRAQACLGESHLLVGRSKPCALGVQDRIDQVGVSQCLF